ncbi:hypothetical protein [Alkaliphilus transvaalensis]|uniref:hypothetical protein n=1 Tax=Alkaliphilus transvaalensis TaxID=114628 RepID=UPI00047D3D15|nr:hypothetical protein [Alkaliphilus transvaalensis]
MHIVEAVLTYRPFGIDENAESIAIGKTAEVSVLRVLRDDLIKKAIDEAIFWEDIDAGIAAMRQAEAEKLIRIFQLILPDEELKGELKLVKGNQEKQRGDRNEKEE